MKIRCFMLLHRGASLFLTLWDYLVNFKRTAYVGSEQYNIFSNFRRTDALGRPFPSQTVSIPYYNKVMNKMGKCFKNDCFESLQESVVITLSYRGKSYCFEELSDSYALWIYHSVLAGCLAESGSLLTWTKSSPSKNQKMCQFNQISNHSLSEKFE